MKLPESNLKLLTYLVKHWVNVAFHSEFNGVTFEKLGFTLAQKFISLFYHYYLLIY